MWRYPRNQLLILSSLLLGGIGMQLLLDPPGAGFEQLARLLPWPAWGALWVAAAAVSMFQAVRRRSPGTVSFGIVVGLLAAWGGGQLFSWWIRWLEGESSRGHGWITPTIFLVSAAILAVASRAIPPATLTPPRSNDVAG